MTTESSATKKQNRCYCKMYIDAKKESATRHPQNAKKNDSAQKKMMTKIRSKVI